MDLQLHEIQMMLESSFREDTRELLLQIAHRLELLKIWQPERGMHILEIGCGQGYTTIPLAVAVGDAGQVLAVDNASPQRWQPSLKDAHAHIKASPLGKRITFQTSTDILSADIAFPKHFFDLVIFSHCSWFLSAPDLLLQLFKRVRPWAKRLGYAEWDIVPESLMQVPHMLAVLLQVHLKMLNPQMEFLNVESLILPQDARAMAQEAGWFLTTERKVDTSMVLCDGWGAELHNALQLSEEFLRQEEMTRKISSSAHMLINTEKNLLLALAQQKTLVSLPTYVFRAE